MKNLMVITTLAFTLAAPAASAEPALALAKPTGDRPVGTTSLSQADLFYPAASARGARKQFMTEAEAKAALDEAGITAIRPSVLTTVRTDAFVDAPPAGRHLPLVVLSSGAELTSLAEDLASHGTVVVVADRGADVPSVLDSLLRSKWAALIDPARIGGDANTIDARLKAGLDLDGTAPAPDRPFLHLGTGSGTRQPDRPAGWKRRRES